MPLQPEMRWFNSFMLLEDMPYALVKMASVSVAHLDELVVHSAAERASSVIFVVAKRRRLACNCFKPINFACLFCLPECAQAPHFNVGLRVVPMRAHIH